MQIPRFSGSLLDAIQHSKPCPAVLGIPFDEQYANKELFWLQAPVVTLELLLYAQYKLSVDPFDVNPNQVAP